MTRRSFRDRFFTPRVAAAVTSPLGILLAGAGGAVGILVGGPLVGVALGAAAWAARVAVAVPRNPQAARIDPFTLGEPWRHYVREAVQARARFDEAVRSTEAGPLRDRLGQIGDRIATGVEECWHVARRAQALVDARRGIDVDDVHRQLSVVARDAGQPWAVGSSLDRTAEALQAQLASAERMDRVIADLHDRLRLLDARLDESVARAIELSVSAGDVSELRGLGDDVDGVVGEMEALRQALEETGGTPATGAA